MCDCLLSKARLRADQIPAQDGTAVYFSGAKHEATDWSVERAFAVLVAPGKDPIESHKTARKFYAELDAGQEDLPEGTRTDRRPPRGSHRHHLLQSRRTAPCSPSRASST